MRRLALDRRRLERRVALAKLGARSAELKAAQDAYAAACKQLAEAQARHERALAAAHELTLTIWRLEWKLKEQVADLPAPAEGALASAAS